MDSIQNNGNGQQQRDPLIQKRINKFNFERKTPSIEQTRTELERVCVEYVNKILGLDGNEPVHQSALGVLATTGAGKSTKGQQIMRDLVAREIPSLVCVPTRAIGADWVNAIGAGARLYQPREAPKPNGSSTKFTCWMMESSTKAGSLNHRPAQSLCNSCPHGQVVNLTHQNKERVAAAKEFFVKNNLNPHNFENKKCRFLYEGNPDQRRALCLVVPQAAFSDAVGQYEYDCGEQVNRFCIFDESFEPAKQIKITPASISSWVDILLDTKSKLARIKNVPREEIEHVDKVIGMFNKLSSSITSDSPIPETEILEIYKSLKDAEYGLVSGTARWESIKFTAADMSYQIVQRAFTNLARSVQAGAVIKVENGLMVFEESPILDWVLNKGNSVVMDATMPLATQKLLESVGGKIHYALAKQNLHITHIKGHDYWKGQPLKAGYAKTAAAFQRDMLKIAEQDGEWACITHKSVWEVLSLTEN